MRMSFRAGQPACRHPLLPRILAVCASQSFEVMWLDPSNREDASTQFDGATERMTSLLSKFIPRKTRYSVSQGSLPLCPAISISPNGRRQLLFAGVQYLQGAGSLASALAGTAPFTEIQTANKTGGATIGRWSAGLVAVTDNRILFYVSAGNVTTRWRAAAGAATSNTGSTILTGKTYVFSSTFSGSDYDGWLDTVEETLSSGGANTRAPATLDTLILGCIWNAGAAANLWIGTQGSLLIAQGVLSSTDRRYLERAIAAYDGYPV